VSDPQSYDARRAISAHRAQERNAWDRFAAAALTGPDCSEVVGDYAAAAYRAAQHADALLAERRRRFPGPRIHLEEEA
jgi:hypothetical protein